MFIEISKFFLKFFLDTLFCLLEFFITGHSEYALYTLDGEYRRDMAKGLPIELPKNYYRDDNPANEPVNRWQPTARKLFGNWIKYYCKLTKI